MSPDKKTLKRYVRPALHGALRLLPARKGKHQEALSPKRILLINGAHVGDVVIATSLLPVLKSAFPEAEIGFLTASWSGQVVRDHPEVAYTHIVDHWRMNRTIEGDLPKRIQYWKTRRRALKEIRALSYDLSVSMHPWRADFLPLAWQAGIPVRVAFSDGLFAPLATVTADYPEHQRFIHQSECQAMLLRKLGIEEKHLKLRHSSLAPSNADSLDEVCRLLRVGRIDQISYVVIHMGAGIPVKELSTGFWRNVASRIAATQTVLFTGKGSREAAKIARVMDGLANCVDACDKLSWEGFVAAIRHARSFYGVDSMAGHVAAAVGTKCIVMHGGMSNLARFRPENRNVTVWSNALPCSACELQFGCHLMTCMKGFDPNKIIELERARATR